MNTQLLQNHLEESLIRLARTCMESGRNEQADVLILKVLKDSFPDDAARLSYIREIGVAQKKLESPSMDIHVEMNLNACYEIMETGRNKQKGELWKKLSALATALEGQDLSSAQSTPLMKFIYRTLMTLNDDSNVEDSLKEIKIVSRITK